MNIQFRKKLEEFFDTHTIGDNSSFKYCLFKKDEAEFICLERIPENFKADLPFKIIDKKTFISKIENKIEGKDNCLSTVHFRNSATLRSIITLAANTLNNEQIGNVLLTFRLLSNNQNPTDYYETRYFNFQAIDKCKLDIDQKKSLMHKMFSNLGEKGNLYSSKESDFCSSDSLKKILELMKKYHLNFQPKDLNVINILKIDLHETLLGNFDLKNTKRKNKEIWTDFVRKCVHKNNWAELIGFEEENKQTDNNDYIKEHETDIVTKHIKIDMKSFFNKNPILISGSSIFYSFIDKFMKHIEEANLKELKTLHDREKEIFEIFINYDSNKGNQYEIFKNTVRDFFEILENKVSNETNKSIIEVLESINISSIIRKNTIEYSTNQNPNEDTKITSIRRKI